jgi:hypothetical protein
MLKPIFILFHPARLRPEDVDHIKSQLGILQSDYHILVFDESTTLDVKVFYEKDVAELNRESILKMAEALRREAPPQ